MVINAKWYWKIDLSLGAGMIETFRMVATCPVLNDWMVREESNKSLVIVNFYNTYRIHIRHFRKFYFDVNVLPYEFLVSKKIIIVNKYKKKKHLKCACIQRLVTSIFKYVDEMIN